MPLGCIIKNYGKHELFKGSSLNNYGGVAAHPWLFKRPDSKIDIKHQVELAQCITGTKQHMDEAMSCLYRRHQGTWKELFGGNAVKRRQYKIQDIPAILIEHQDVFELALGISIHPGKRISKQILDDVIESVKTLLVSLNYIKPKRVTSVLVPSITVLVPITLTPRKKRRPLSSPAPSFMKEYPIVFEALHATSGHMLSSSRIPIAEQV